MRDASSTIKILRLLVKESGFSFKAGQWVDFYVPGISEVTGYSMTSHPYDAKEKGILELSVKYGKFPPTHWVHTQCCSGEEVQIRVGGDFFYDPLSDRSEAEADLLLVGGGVGINPLVSILCEYTDLHTRTELQSNGIKPGNVHLLYSAKTEEELVFKDTFIIMETEYPSLTCQYYVTKDLEHEPNPGIKCCRIGKKDILESIKKLQHDKTICYICGPSTMTDDVANWLYSIGIKKDYVRYEKWW